MPAFEASGFVGWCQNLSYCYLTVNEVLYLKENVLLFWVDFGKYLSEMDTNFTIFPSRMNLVFEMGLYLGLLT